jgi:signal transduction histidine kinase/CHASE1-domain containing sensor protein
LKFRVIADVLSGAFTVHSLIKGFVTAKHAILMGFCVSSAVGALCFYAAEQSIESDSRQRFLNYTQPAQNTINARIKSYTDVLRGTASFFQTSDDIRNRQFRDYVNGLSIELFFPAIETINFAYYFGDEARPAFERQLKEEQSAGEARLPPFGITPPGRRPEYSVITYIEPVRTWKGGYGFDLQSNDYVSKTILGSRDTKVLMTSGTAIAAMSGPNRIGLGMRLPVYRQGMPTTTVDERRAAYKGSVGIAISVPKLVQGVLAAIPIRNVRMTLTDAGVPSGKTGAAPKGDRVLYDTMGTEQVPTPPIPTGSDRVNISLPVDFNGRPWKAIFQTGKRDLYRGAEAHFSMLALMAGFVSTMLIFALLYTLTTSRKRAILMAREMTKELRASEAKLQISHRNLRWLAAHADRIKEDERKRIAREIHDDLGQNLLALRIEADMLASRTGASHPRLYARAKSTLTQIDTTIKSVRQIINDLRPNVLDLGLSAAVEWQIAEFIRRTGIRCDLIALPDELKLNDNCATALFRILQESLSNVVRHARATAVEVKLRLHANELSMDVSDNGVGLPDRARSTASFGLIGIEERISMLGGSFAITSEAGIGTTVHVSVPLQPDGSASATAQPSPVAPSLEFF